MSETLKLAAILVTDVVGCSRLAAPTRSARSRGCARCAATSSPRPSRSIDYFADRVTENLTTELSRIRDSFVIVRNTASR